MGPGPTIGNMGCYPLAPIHYRVATRKSEPLYIAANLWASQFKITGHKFSIGEWVSPHLPPTTSISFGSIDVDWLRLPGAVAEGHLIPCFMEYKLEACCNSPCGGEVAHGYRSASSWTSTEHYADGKVHKGVSTQENQTGLAGAFMLACTRAPIAPKQVVRLPMPPDLSGQTLDKVSESMSAGILKLLVCKDGYYEFSFRLWVRGAGTCGW